MNGFLDSVAADLYGRYGEGVSSLSMVFPSVRASLFFGEALSGLIRRPLWQPASVTIDAVAEELSGLSTGDRLRLVTELFKVYREFHPAENFDTFYFWGELLLGDFDSIDKYLVDADMLFSNLVDLHEIDGLFDYLDDEQRRTVERFWGSFSGNTPEQRDFLTVWRTLAPIYHKFKARLVELGTAYQGMVYREAAERIRTGRAPQIPERHYVVAGFNALSRSEQVIFEHLKREFKVDFYWDYDDYFVEDRDQEAGMFMRDNLRRFPPVAPLSGGHNNFRKPKTVRSVAAAGDVLQCKYAGKALSEIAHEAVSARAMADNALTETQILKGAGAAAVKPPAAAPGRETAVVLCDENLLEPLLWSMPPEVDGLRACTEFTAEGISDSDREIFSRDEGGVGVPTASEPGEKSTDPETKRPRAVKSVQALNITMGYPLRMHPAYTFVERLIELQNRRRRGAFYHSDVEGLLHHPYLGGHDLDIPPYVYINASRLHTSPIFKLIFSVAGEEGKGGGDWRRLSEYLIEVIAQVSQLPFDEGDNMLERRVGFFEIIVEHIRRLTNSLDSSEVEVSTRTFAVLLRRSLQGVRVPFEGEPLEGVQIMGILETRALDFENVIFLSAGDDRMPGNLVGAPSFIPYNLKAAYSLPTPEHHEGVYAYHFFRLVTRARRIDAVWSRTTDDRNSGTPSRYILQLDYSSPHEVEHETVSVDVNLPPAEPIVVEKDIEKIPHRLSPSLFYAYVECPLKFYFRGIAHLKAEEEVSEEVDGALFGNILHRAMQILYAPLTGVRDPREKIRALVGSAEVERAVTAAVRELYKGAEGAAAEDWGGNTVLAHKAVTDYIDRGILPYDARSAESFTIERLEERIETEVEFGSGEGLESGPDAKDGAKEAPGEGAAPRSVVFSGIADRIDRLSDGALRVVDYKTGNPKNNASALLQMGLYAMMLKNDADGGAVPSVDAALYYVRDISKPDYAPPPVPHEADFGENLRATLAELFDPAVPFTQCPDPKPCEWCDYRTICRR